MRTECPGFGTSSLRWALGVGVFVALACGAVSAAQAPPVQTGPAPLAIQAGRQGAQVVAVATMLGSVWDLAFIPGGRDILFTERAGRMRIIRDGVLDPTPVWVMPPEPLDKQSSGKEFADRLHMIALHPRFDENHLVYLSYVKWDAMRGHTMAVARGRFTGSALVDVKDIFVADAWAGGPDPTAGNLGGGLLFGPDQMLYMTVGDRDLLYGTDDATQRMRAQDPGNHAGKVLRLRDDGTAPTDNPLVKVAGARPEIYTIGHRAGYGLAFNPVTGILWQADIGPMGGDELNALLPGHNYGWPLVSLGRNYSGGLVSDNPWWRPGMDMPQVYWNPVVSPSSLLFYTGDKFPRWKGSLFVGALTTRRLLRIPFNSRGEPMRQEELLGELGVRIRDIAQGPDGNLYIAAESGYYDETTNATNGAVYRIEPRVH